MGTPVGPRRRGVASAVVPVGPSWLVKLMLRPMTKILNPPIGKLAGRRHFPMASVHHTGRHSGTHYVTSVGARVGDGEVLIPLTFGNRSDWARNVSAAGECVVHVNGKAYHAVRPRFLTAAEATPRVRAAFGSIERLSFRMLGIKQYMQLQVAE
jgi:deazaflavin-dependent oxidoreductase (nitroreductase family)